MMVMSSWPMIVRPTRRGAWIGKSYFCIWHHNCYKTGTPGHSGLGFKKKMFAHFSSPSRFWVFLTGYVLATEGVGDVRAACLFPLVKSKCFLDSGVRRCCKVGHSCTRRVIDCSSVPHKMALRSVAGAMRTVARLGGQGCEIFDISQLRLNSTVCFENWIRRQRGVAGDVGAPCLALVLSLQILIKHLKLAPPQRCSLRGDISQF